jgi:hypothetical protein
LPLTLMKIHKTIKYWSTNNCIAKHRTCLVWNMALNGSHQIIMKWMKKEN